MRRRHNVMRDNELVNKDAGQEASEVAAPKSNRWDVHPADPTWFGRSERPQFGWLHQPAGGSGRAIAVLCPPLGHEAANTLPAFQELGGQLAASNIAALRFDYSGTGDSAGAWQDEGRLDDWVMSIHEAIQFARSVCSGSVVLVGIRIGALLAAEAIARGTSVDGFVQWDPCMSGREFLRKEKVLFATAYGASQVDDGTVRGPAFTYDAKTAADLNLLRFAPAPRDSSIPILVADRTGGTSNSTWATSPASNVEWVAVEGQPELIEAYPDTAIVPMAATATVADWIARMTDGPLLPLTFAELPAACFDSGYEATSVCERALRLGPHKLFAMETVRSTEEDVVDDADSVTVVFLTAGALDHTGPGRKWVDLARQFAAQGIRSIRVDLDGIGESFGRDVKRRNEPKPLEAIDDLCDLAGALGDPDGRGLVFVGLSSGAYHALEAGLHLHPAGVVAINPSLVSGGPGWKADSEDPRRRATRRMPRSLRSLAVNHGRVARWLWCALLQFRVSGSPSSPVGEVCRRGAALLLILSESERRQFELSLYWGLIKWRLRHQGKLAVAYLEGDDHSTYIPESQRHAYGVVSEWMTSRFAPASRRAAASRGAAAEMASS